MAYRPDQRVNAWIQMLAAIYGGSQNYSKSAFEIHAHLSEVCGVFAKHYFKRRDPELAKTFVPKMLAWVVALAAKVSLNSWDFEQLILRKFPNACPYCGGRPCRCWKSEKPTLAPEEVKRMFHQNAPSVGRTLNDFQLMFREIYGHSWRARGNADPVDWIFIRLMEELAEVGEAVRFHHLYPDNLQNELADFAAWWFALVSTVGASGGDVPLAEDVMWRGYPGFCPTCQMVPCYCRPGPVRELMSRPAPGQDHRFDSLTSTYNQGAYLADIADIQQGRVAVKPPIACARVDLDDFKAVNSNYGHPAGDAALRHVATTLRRKVRERDRLYRAGGDEFAVVFLDYTEEEAAGALKRAIAELRQSPVRWVGQNGAVSEFPVSVSVGVAECQDPAKLERSFETADKAAYRSKELGKAQVTQGRDLSDGSGSEIG
jgi:diguanylate cyclase (GGDEF)-like protein